MKKYYGLVLLIVFLSTYSIAQYDGDQIFDESYIHEIRITTSLNADELFSLYGDGILTGEYEYALADITIDGINVDSVGLRVKGGSSAFDSKKPYKLDFNEFVSGQKYDGLKKINLHQGNMDPSFMREALAYGLMRNAGVKTVRTSFTKLYINEEYEGIYTLVEQVNDDFIHNHFASGEGALYKTQFDILSLKYEVDSSFPYEEFETAVNQIPIDSLDELLPEYLDVKSFLRFISTEIFLNNVDGPLTVNTNYFIYYEPKSKTYVYIPWDYNLSLYGFVNHTIMRESANFIFEKVKQNSRLRAQYISTFCELLMYTFNEDRILGLIESYDELLRDEVPSDPYISQIGNFDEAVSTLKEVISSRVQSLTDEMLSNYSTCIDLRIAIEAQFIVVNEIVASNDVSSGITDPAGGAADWIELYNNTEGEIPMYGLYLSNDSDFLKHWQFPDDLVIPPNDYLIVWADRDIDEEGLHADFKLNKSLGELYLSFASGEIIDSMSYSDQSTNIGFARSPNGTGAFVRQASTFNASNDLSISTEDQSMGSNLSIFPNPTFENTELNVKSSYNFETEIKVANLYGQTLWKTKVRIYKGNNVITIPSSGFNTGIYSLILTSIETNERSIQQFVVAK